MRLKEMVKSYRKGAEKLHANYIGQHQLILIEKVIQRNNNNSLAIKLT